jgi:hypothetical protein
LYSNFKESQFAKFIKKSEESIMKKVMLFCILICLTLMTGPGAGDVLAASGKCTVVKVDGDGKRMVIECNKQTKGFSEGNQIKIKTDKKKDN